MRRSHRIMLAGAVVVAVGGAILTAPRVLPALPGFDVRRVEVVGASLLTAHEVLRSSGIREGQSVWEDPAQWEEPLEAHAVIQSVRVTRRLPGTLRVRVREKQPVAYVAAEVLAPVTAAGEILLVDPTRAAPDLPLVRPNDAGEVPPALFLEAERLARMDPELLAEISEIRARDDEGRILVLRHREAEIVVPAGVPAERLDQLRAVLTDLDERGSAAVGITRIDLRFADQVVVRLPSSVQKP